MAKSTHYHVSFGDYADTWKPVMYDSGDRETYGHGACYAEKVVEVNGKPCTIRYMVKKASRRRGARQFVS